MIICNRCKELTHEKFILIHKQCEYCGLNINENIYEFIGTEKEAKNIGGCCTSTPKVGELYIGNDTRFCIMDGTIDMLAEIYPNIWKNITILEY